MSLTRRGPRTTAVLTLFVLLTGFAALGRADVLAVTAPQMVATTDGESATLSIPRWKGHMDPQDPGRLWVSYGASSSSSSNVAYTPDGGRTWQNTGMNPNISGSLNYHAALFGHDGDLYFTFPASAGVGVRRFRSPAEDNDDRDPISTVPGTTGYHRSSVMVDGDGRLWVFTRRSNDAGANVRYGYSDDKGQTWTYGTAVDTGAPNVRIGSMPFIDGRACLVVLHLQDARGYEFYVWNGTSFEARADHSIFAQDVGYIRAFTHNIVGDTMHLVIGLGGQLRHFWKSVASESGAWNDEVILTSTVTDGIDMLPTSTVRGDELYLFYCLTPGGSASSSAVHARVWNRTTATWGGQIDVSTASTSTNVHPNTCFRVPAAAPYVPVFWSAGSSGQQIMFSKLEVGSDDIVPPDGVRDLQASVGDGAGSAELTWTAPGDDGDEGQAVAYDFRCATDPITALTWNVATQLTNEPAPAAAGVTQTMTVERLVPGTLYYFAMKTVDDGGNVSGISNVPRAEVPLTTDGPAPDLSAAILLPGYPNPFNPRTTIPFVLARPGSVRLTVHDVAGRTVAELLDGHRAAGRHEISWNGLSRSGAAVPSGVYSVRLRAGGEVQARQVILVR